MSRERTPACPPPSSWSPTPGVTGSRRWRTWPTVAGRARRRPAAHLARRGGRPRLRRLPRRRSRSRSRPRSRGIHPPTREMAEAVAAVCRRADVSTVVVMDADQSLKRWWYAAPLASAGGPAPASRVHADALPGQAPAHRLDGVEAAGAEGDSGPGGRWPPGRCTARPGSRVATTRREGWIVKRTRDPDLCTAHSRDRARLRAELGLPAGRRLVGIFGVISERKNAD